MTYGKAMTAGVRATLLATAAAILTIAGPAQAQKTAFNLPADNGRKSIVEFARQAGIQISAPTGQLNQIRTRPVFGMLDARDALARMLEGTGLVVASDSGTMIVLRRAPAARATAIGLTAPAGGNRPRTFLQVAALQPQPAAMRDAPPRIDASAAGDRPAAAGGDEIVVTAQRREQLLSDVGMSITAIGAQALATRNITQAEDLAKLVPGLSVSDSGFATPIYTLRGVGINEPSLGSSSSVAVYVDEVPLAYPVTTQGAALDLQRIEVLKGPQGTLYGQNSTGGAINYIARKPTDRFEAGLTGSFGRFDRGSLEAYVSGPLGPTLKARIAARAVIGGGWQRSLTRDDTLGKVRNLTGRAIVEWEPAADLRVTVNLNGWTDRSDTVAPQLVARTISVPANADPVFLAAPLPPHDARDTDWDRGVAFDRDDSFWQGSVRAQWAMTDALTLTAISAYTHLDRAQRSDQDGVDGNVTRNTVDGRIESFSQEVRLAADFSGIRGMIGGNLAYDETREVNDQALALFSAIRGRTNGTGIRSAQKIDNKAIFANVELPLTAQLTISGGIRYSEETRKFRGCSFTFDAFSGPAQTAIVNAARARAGLPPIATLQAGECYSIYNSAAAASIDTAGLPPFVPGEASLTLSENNVPWNLNVNFKPGATSLLYARVSRGFKAGNFATLAGTDLGAYTPIVQERLTAYEAGARASFGRWLRLEGALFRYDYIDKQLRARKLDPVLGNINAQTNIPKSRLKGAEAAATIMPVHDLSLAVSGTYIHSEIRDYTGFTINNVPNVDFSGTPFNFTPKYSVNADLNYALDLSEGVRGFIGVNYAYRSTTSSIFVPPGVTGLDIYEIKSYSLVDGQLGIEAPDDTWRAWLWGKNIFNRYYWTNVVKVSDVTVRYPGMPTTFGVSASVKF